MVTTNGASARPTPLPALTFNRACTWAIGIRALRFAGEWNERKFFRAVARAWHSRARLLQSYCGVAALARAAPGERRGEHRGAGVPASGDARRNPGAARGRHARAAVHFRRSGEPASVQHAGRRVCAGQLVAVQAAGAARRGAHGLGPLYGERDAGAAAVWKCAAIWK